MISRAAIRRPGLAARRPGLRRPLVALLLAGAVVIVTACAPDGTPEPVALDGPVAQGLAVPALHLDDVPANIADHYEFADANRDVYDEVPCYCGCEKSIGHRNLTDCFVRSDGTGWDAHAAGCAICVDESIAVRRLMADGADAPTIRDSIITGFGPLATPTTTTST